MLINSILLLTIGIVGSLWLRSIANEKLKASKQAESEQVESEQAEQQQSISLWQQMINLNIVNNIGAAIPIVLTLVKHPVRNVDIAIINKLILNENIRPYLSPRYPNTIPPNGRMKNAPANIANEFNACSP